METWSNPYIIILGFVPLIGGFCLRKKTASPMKEVMTVFASFASVISVLILLNRLFVDLDLPISFILLTAPALVIMLSLYIFPNLKEKEKDLNIFAFVLCMLGYVVTFFILLDRIYPAPVGIYPFHTRESLIGITSAVIFYGLTKKQ